MRQLFAVGVIVLIGMAMLTFTGALFPEDSFLNEVSDAIRVFVAAIGDSLTGSVRGVG